MKNIPRIFVDAQLKEVVVLPLSSEQYHYLTRVMRTDKFLVFNGGAEYEAAIENKSMRILGKTGHADPSGDWVFYFAPIKHVEDLIAGIVQMGAGTLQPVITEHTAARHINWERMRKIIIENAEQSGRNSLSELRAPILFADLEKEGLIYGDERKCIIDDVQFTIKNRRLFVGPEGGFSDAEFNALDKAGAIGVGLGKTILRAETAAVALCARALN